MLRRVLTTLFVALISNSGEGIFCSAIRKHFQHPVSFVPFPASVKGQEVLNYVDIDLPSEASQAI